jgi:hypothetical protein
LKQRGLPAPRELCATACLAVVLVLATACSGAPGAGQRQSVGGSTDTSASAQSAPKAVDYAALFKELPVLKGATQVERTAKALTYVVRGAQGEMDMRALYKRELEKRGWRFYDQMGSVTVYQKDGYFVDVGRDWMGNGEVLAAVSQP